MNNLDARLESLLATLGCERPDGLWYDGRDWAIRDGLLEWHIPSNRVARAAAAFAIASPILAATLLVLREFKGRWEFGFDVGDDGFEVEASAPSFIEAVIAAGEGSTPAPATASTRTPAEGRPQEPPSP